MTLQNACQFWHRPHIHTLTHTGLQYSTRRLHLTHIYSIAMEKVSKETYASVKRDLHKCQKRPTKASKETYAGVKRDLRSNKYRETFQNACQFWQRLPARKVERFRACEWEVPRSVVCFFSEILDDVCVPVQLGQAQRRISREIECVDIGATPHQRPATEEASHGCGDV